MKKSRLAALVVSVLTLILVGCSSNYVLHTNDGHTIVTQGKPNVDKDTGMISYKDSSGVKQQINQNEVSTLQEVEQ